MSLPGYQLHQGQVTIEQATTTVTVQLTKLVTVLFTVNEGATALSNALVTVSPKGAKSSRYQMQQHTNANGQAVLKLPANAEFSYTVLLPSYTPVLSSFTLGEQDLSIEIPLQRKLNNVTFTVTDGYAPLPGVTVDVEGTTAQTDTAGVAKFALLPGDHTYQIAHAPYAPVAGSITATEGFNEEVVLLQNYTITFVLKGDDGTPLAQAKLTVAGTEYAANPQGRIPVTLAPGSYRYTAQCPQYYDTVGAVTVTHTDAEEVVLLRSWPAYPVVFTVTSGQTRIPRATITVEGKSTKTDGNGQAELRLRNGNYSYTVSKSGFETKTGTFTVADNGASLGVDLTRTSTAIRPIDPLLAGAKAMPNPCQHELTLSGVAHAQRIIVLNAAGQQVLIHEPNGAEEIYLDVADLPAGLYIVLLERADAHHTLRVVKQ